MKPNRMGCSLLPFTHATATHTRWGAMDEFEACNVLAKHDGTSWNSGAFAPVSLTVGWEIPQRCIAGLCLTPDMVPETGVVEVEVRVNNERLCTHTADWTGGRVLNIPFPHVVHTSAVKLTFTQSPSWIALFWIEAWQFRGVPTVVRSPISLTTGPVPFRRRVCLSVLE